jgi:hypothetical protein
MDSGKEQCHVELYWFLVMYFRANYRAFLYRCAF